MRRCCYCLKTFWVRRKSGAAQRFCTPKCQVAGYNSKSKEVLGRLCDTCNRSDSEALWSRTRTMCSACCRLRVRHGECKTCRRGLAWVRGLPHKTKVCVFCDAENLKDRGFIPIDILCPGDDRTRTIWRLPDSKTKAIDVPAEIKRFGLPLVLCSPFHWEKVLR